MNWQVLRYIILCICKVPNLQLAEQSLYFYKNKLVFGVVNILLFSQNPQFPALIDSTELAHLEYYHYPLDGMLFPSRVTASNDYVAGSINTPVAGENQCRAKIPF